MHRLLKRQLNRNFIDPNQIPEELRPFCEAVNKAYYQYDSDRSLLERSLDLTSKELMQANAQLMEAFDKLKAAQAGLVQSERLSSLGQLVAGVAHEINNPAGFIHGGVVVLLERVKELREYLTGVMDERDRVSPEGVAIMEQFDSIEKLTRSLHNGSNRIREIVQGLRNFSRMDQGKRTLGDLNEGVRQTLEIIRFRFKNGIEVHEIYGDLPPIWANHGQMNQVVMNMMANAVDALQGGGNFWVETGFEDGMVFISFRDDGKGMAKEVKAKMFEPFFTTKEVGRGTGLGLSISFGVVQEHGGRIEVESAPGNGTTVTVKFPNTQGVEELPLGG